MGLCKCPKRNITNQFCYEHRVNVCENCMVQNHKKCVVQSYLQWLQDSDYNPNCEFCQQSLSDETTVRLSCYHVFHWVCLDKYARGMPSDTAPAGYTCPACNECIFPPDNLVSPVADQLRKLLSDVNWARAGLGMALLEDHSERKPEFNIGPRPTPEGQCIQGREVGNSKITSPLSTSINFEPSNRNNNGLIMNPPSQSSSATAPLLGSDPDENKYKRRSAIELLGRWWRNTYPSSNRRRNTSQQRHIATGIILFIAFLTLIVLFSKFGSRSTANDPMFDPLNNPDIRIGQD